ncbi:PREDICTED: co-chaperone protein daf-41-like [Acropora digitifera]|uniref:co-chaperone protein daf-41-like n=1 Tax=Acropora digitifera TaxID=70779 RepID=UPI00077AB16C|nr:PREDICTED: co-chaperone protein daf-41-like [Acropora digitifera]
MGEITMLHPSTKWAQRRDRILLTIELSDCQKPDISLDTNSLKFSAKGGKEQKNYTLELKFHKEVNPEVRFTFSLPCDSRCCEKKLLLARNFTDNDPSFLHTDFSRWQDEDDSEEEDTGIDDNFESMMSQMGGAGGQNFDPGEVNSDDSDDEELPDLDS